MDFFIGILFLLLLADGHVDMATPDLKMCLKPDWFQCALPHGPCLEENLICNGIENCPGGEDELNCVHHQRDSSTDLGTGGWHSLQRNCTKYQYTCQSDHSCISLNFMCDGKMDCDDGSDETTGCIRAEANCMGFVCHNKRCLESIKWVCDGIDDCGDGSDEMNCADNCIPEMGKFLCHNNITCIPLEKACDNKTDCPDKTDESIRCTASKDCKSKICPPASKCQMMPQSGPTCICPNGFRHSLHEDICVDINECLEQYGVCSQGCINVPGTYKCTCHDGYTLAKDNRTCEAYGEEAALLLYTTQVTVMGINLRYKKVYTVAKNLAKVIGVSYNGEHIYWTNIQDEGESIVKANLDGSQPEILLTSGLDAPEDLAVDWLTGNIYFSDNVMHHIAVCSNNGHFCTVLITDDVHQPRGVALWPQRSQIFWSDWGINPMIARASMDGTNSKRLVTEKIHWPNGIALDVYNDRIYWVDAKLGTIESVRSDGTDRRMVLEEIPKHPYGLAIFEDHIFWSDWGTKSIHSCNKFTGKDHKIITKDRTIYAVHIYHPSKQKKTSHACEKSRCSHLCLLAENNTFSCACPDGMQLGTDQFRCVKTHKKQVLFLGIRENLLEMEHTTFGRHSITKTHKLDMYIHQLAYNSVNNSVFVADNYQRIIAEVDLQSNINNLVKGSIGNITALAFDHLSYTLYWSDSERHVVEVLSLQTKHRAIVSFFSGLEAPIGLALIPEEGKMFIALKSRRRVHIDQKSLNGLGEHSHVFEDELGDDDIRMVSDFATNTLYWSDSDLCRISFSDYRNLQAYTFRGRLKRPYSIAIVDEDLFWTELNSNTVHWTHKSNMGPLKRFDVEINQEIYAKHVLPTRIPLTASSTKQISDHPCQHWNGGCSHVCVSLGKMASGCLCPAGLLFKDAKNSSCIEALDCEFRCRSGECLTLLHKCNNRIDCSDRSDEEDCDEQNNQKPKVVCLVGEFMCRNAEKCLEAHKRCDGKTQCPDGSDEDHCQNFDKTKNCHLNQLVCDNGNCVDFSVMCDGSNDCGDNSDEKSCKLSPGKDVSLRPNCAKDMFQCNSGTCIAKSWECDSKIDCPDASDEHDKCSIMDCPSDMHRCLLGQCIDKRLVCDGHNDCGDNSDELNCDNLTSKKLKMSCGDERNPMYECPNYSNMCLDLSAKCNGTAECPRGEDEADCDYACTIYEFQCKTSKECIRSEFRCDNEKDCADGSDEKNCNKRGAWNASVAIHTHEKPCGPKMWDCRDGECVDQTRVCDGIEDCDTGADEGPLCKTACKSLGGRAPCDNKCKSTPAGAVCSCFNGYKLDSDNCSCFDINECDELDPCAQICENNLGSYRCSCYPGFMLRPDKTTCKSIESEKSLLFSTYDEVRSMTEQPVMLKVAWKTNDTKIKSFDLNVRTREAYFSTDNENILYKIDVDTAEVKSALELPMPDTVAVDWITGNVYVKCRSQVHEIQVCSFSAKMCGTILKVKPHETIKTLTVDAYNRRLFFVVVQVQTFGNHNSRIITANLDGSKRQILVAKEGSFITNLACDPYKKKLYYTDMHQKNLQGINYHLGSKHNPMSILEKGNIIMYPSGLTWYENQVFIINLGSKEAIRCHLYGTKTCKSIQLNILNAQDILVDGASRQPMKRDPCNMANCHGMCVQTEFGYECMCGDDIVSETKQCYASNEVISSVLLNNQQIRENRDQDSTHVLVVWCLIILLFLVLCAVAYIYYYRKKRGRRDFIPSLHFHNPLASFMPQYGKKTEMVDSRQTLTGIDTSSSSGSSTAARFDVEREKLFMGSSHLQRLLHGSKSSHESEILLETAKPHHIHEDRKGEQRPLIRNLLVESTDDDNTLLIGDMNEDAKARLVP